MEWFLPNTHSDRRHPMSRRKRTHDLTQVIHCVKCLSIVWLFGSMVPELMDSNMSVGKDVQVGGCFCCGCVEHLEVLRVLWMLTLYITNAYRLTNKELLFTSQWYQQWGNKGSKFEKSAKQRPPPKSSQNKLPRFLCLFICKRRMANERRLDKGESTWKDENALCIFMLWVFYCSFDIRLPFEFTLFWLMKPSKLKPDDVQLKIAFFVCRHTWSIRNMILFVHPFMGKWDHQPHKDRFLKAWKPLLSNIWGRTSEQKWDLVMDDFLLLTSADGVLPGGIDSINYQLPKSANHQDRLV